MPNLARRCKMISYRLKCRAVMNVYTTITLYRWIVISFLCQSLRGRYTIMYANRANTFIYSCNLPRSSPGACNCAKYWKKTLLRFQHIDQRGRCISKTNIGGKNLHFSFVYTMHTYYASMKYACICILHRLLTHILRLLQVYHRVFAQLIAVYDIPRLTFFGLSPLGLHERGPWRSALFVKRR